MKTEGRQRGQNGDEARAESNVLQFPRDWIGPRDQLVPFGARADSAVESEVRSDTRVEPEPPLPPGADDFWGEGSAAVQDALQAPRPVAPLGDFRHGARPEPRRRRHRPPGRTVTLVVGLGVAAIVCAAVVLTSITTHHVAHLNRLPALAPTPARVLGSGLTTPHDVASARSSHHAKRHPAKPRTSRAVRTRSRPAHSGARPVAVTQAASRPSSGSTHSVKHSAPTQSTTPAAPTPSTSPSVDSSSSAGTTASPSSGSSSSAVSDSGSGEPREQQHGPRRGSRRTRRSVRPRTPRMTASCARTVTARDKTVKIAGLRYRVASGRVLMGNQPEASEQ